MLNISFINAPQTQLRSKLNLCSLIFVFQWERKRPDKLHFSVIGIDVSRKFSRDSTAVLVDRGRERERKRA